MNGSGSPDGLLKKAPAVRIVNPKLEARNAKFETISKDRIPNVPNKRV
jgi:hypothetical protein